MTALFKDPSGRSPYWYYSLPDPASARGSRRLSTKRTNKAEARRVAEEAIRRLRDREQLGALDEVTLDEALQRYLRATANKRDATNIAGRVAKVLGRLRTQPGRWHLEPTLPFHELTTRHLNRLREARQAEGNAPQTINHELKAISAAYHLLKDEGVRVPATLKFPVAKVAGKLRWFTEDEVRRLLAQLDPKRVFVGKRGKMVGVAMTLNPIAQRQRQDAYDLVVFLLDTGCRYSEVGEMPWSAIDTVGWHWVDIYRTKTATGDQLTMTPRLRAVLQRRWRDRSNSAYVFPGYSDDGKDTPRGKSTQAIRRAIERAGLNAPDLVQRYGRATTHTLRDTFASWLVQRGMSLFKVQRLLGHADPRMTQKYAKLEPRGVADEAAALLSNVGD